MRRYSVVLFCLLGSLVFAECERGDISGKVVDSAGRPIVGAEVRTLPEECILIGKEPVATTDQDGLFILRNVPTGTNGVYARKESEGFPDTRYAVFADPQSPVTRAVVQAHQVVSNVTVVVRKSGTIAGKVVDVQTGKPVLSARIILERENDPDKMLATSPGFNGDFRFVLPRTPIRFRVTAPGYDEWQYQGSGQSPHGVIELRGDEHQEIVVQLKAKAVR